MPVYWVRSSATGLWIFVARLINIVFGVIIGILVLRLILRLVGASAQAPAIAWIYDITASLLRWFAGMLPDIVFDTRYVLELTTLVAIIIYGLICNLSLWILNMLSPPTIVP